jgi:hypothetical protein
MPSRQTKAGTWLRGPLIVVDRVVACHEDDVAVVRNFGALNRRLIEARPGHVRLVSVSLVAVLSSSHRFLKPVLEDARIGPQVGGSIDGTDIANGRTSDSKDGTE